MEKIDLAEKYIEQINDLESRIMNSLEDNELTLEDARWIVDSLENLYNSVEATLCEKFYEE